MIIYLTEGDDVTEILGVTKWDPPEMTSGNGEAAGSFPSYLIDKTDEPRVQSCPQIIQEFQGKTFYISQKADGTSSSFLFDTLNGSYDEFLVCSRNLRIKDGDNKYWNIARKYRIEEILRIELAENRCIGIQGEICGPGIQSNRLNLKELELFVFNVFDVANSRYFDYEEMIEFCDRYNLKTVKILYDNYQFDSDVSIDSLLKMADIYYDSGYPAEGIVIRTMTEQYSKALKNRFSFKVINNKYLLKEK